MTKDSQDGALRNSVDATKDAAESVAKKASDQIDANPLAAVAGGLALGAIVGALVPRSQRERDLLSPIGGKLKEAAVEASQAAKSAGMAELDERGLTKDAVKDRGKNILDDIAKTLSTAGSAALKSAKSSD